MTFCWVVVYSCVTCRCSFVVLISWCCVVSASLESSDKEILEVTPVHFLLTVTVLCLMYGPLS